MIGPSIEFDDEIKTVFAALRNDCGRLLENKLRVVAVMAMCGQAASRSATFGDVRLPTSLFDVVNGPSANSKVSETSSILWPHGFITNINPDGLIFSSEMPPIARRDLDSGTYSSGPPGQLTLHLKIRTAGGAGRRLRSS